MIISKVRMAKDFNLTFSMNTTNGQSHSKVSERESTIHEILNARLDALKIELQQYISSFPDKV